MLRYLIMLLLGFALHCAVDAQHVKVYETFDEYESVLKTRNDTTYVVNFWATWCKPCVEEMPGFIKLDEEFRDKKFKLVLTSLDFDNQLESKVKPYIRENDIKAEVVLLADSKAHLWIDRVDKNWNGSIPATIIFNKDFYFFKEGMLSYNELNEIITKNLIQ
jgi:thiol-disulfide isomerase/thioredoxin